MKYFSIFNLAFLNIRTGIFFTTREAFVPPKPKELDSARSILFFLALSGNADVCSRSIKRFAALIFLIITRI